MPRYIAFLRAINIGGHNVKMADLRGLFEDMGFAGVETLIASGNVIFETKSRSAIALEKKIEGHLHRSLGYEVATFIRTDKEVAAVAQCRPFKEPAMRSAGAFNVAFLKTSLTKEGEATLMGLQTKIDDFYVNDCEVYWLCRKKQSESTFSNAVFEKALGVCTTFRGMKTITRLAAKYPHG